MSQGNLFVVSAPSGTGKTTILKKIINTVPGLAFSISHTTRKSRPGEQNGVDYHFVDQDTFLEMRADNAFLESAEVHGNLYGTSRDEVNKHLAAGTDILLDIDVQGGRQIRKAGDNSAIFVFIMPPSWEELEKRLSGRGTDQADTIKLRLANARREMADAENYDYAVVNDKIDEAVDTLRSIIIAERSKKRRSTSGAPLTIL